MALKLCWAMICAIALVSARTSQVSLDTDAPSAATR